MQNSKHSKFNLNYKASLQHSGHLQQIVIAVNIHHCFHFQTNKMFKMKTNSTSPHLFQCWDDLKQDFSHCLDVGTDA